MGFLVGRAAPGPDRRRVGDGGGDRCDAGAQPRRSPWPTSTRPRRAGHDRGPGLDRRRAGLLRSLFERATAAEGRLPRPAARRRAAPGRAGGGDGRRRRQGRRRPAAAVRRAAMLGGRPRPPPRASPCSAAVPAWRRCGCRCCGPMQPDAGVDAPTSATALADVGGAAVGGVEARRRPHPGAPRRRRGPGLHPQPERHHRAASPRWSRWCGACRPNGWCSTARCSAWPRTVAPAPFQDTMSRFGADGRRAPTCSGRSSSTSSTSTATTWSTGRSSTGSACSNAVAGAVADPGDRHRRPGRGGGVRRRRAGRRPRGRDGQGARRAYEAGRRGKAWRKVKPVRTLDLVVLAAEWGHGRRTGWLSNLHLGARDPDGGVRDGGQDVQGPHRRAARLADRALPRARGSQATASPCSCDPSWSWRSPSTACRCRPATPAASPCASPASSATGPTRTRPRPTPSRWCRPSCPAPARSLRSTDDVDAGGLAADEG